ncbi:MAG: hypothetical protein ACRBBR_00600 [Cellvibrionaceae bacterium]
MNKKLTLMYLFSFLSSFTLTATADLSKVKNCYANSDYLCSYSKLMDFIKADPSNRPIISQRRDYLTTLGKELSLYLILAEAELSPASVMTNADKGIELITSSSKNKYHSSNLIPYYTLKAEACISLKDKECTQSNADRICTTLIKNGFSWPREKSANNPISGRERVNKIKMRCSEAAKEDPRNASIYIKIDEYISAITSKEDIDQYQTLFVPPTVLKRMIAKNRWPEVKKDIEKRNPQLLKILSYIKDKKADFEFHRTGYRATFDLSDYPEILPRDSIIFSMRDDVWYVR